MVHRLDDGVTLRVMSPQWVVAPVSNDFGLELGKGAGWYGENGAAVAAVVGAVANRCWQQCGSDCCDDGGRHGSVVEQRLGGSSGSTNLGRSWWSICGDH